jgi:hypothetical protein
MQPDCDIVYCNSIAINELTPLNGIYFLTGLRLIFQLTPLHFAQESTA